MPPISTNRTVTSHLTKLNIEKTTKYDDGNPDPGLEPNEFPTSPSS